MSHQSPQVIRSPWRDFLHAFVRNPLALVSGGFVLLLILVAIFAPGWLHGIRWHPTGWRYPRPFGSTLDGHR